MFMGNKCVRGFCRHRTTTYYRENPMLSKSMLKLLTCATAIATITACGETTRVAGGTGGGSSSSDLTAVNISLPNREGLKTQVADIETKMNAYRLVIKSGGGGCVNPTSIDKVEAYSQNPVISASLQQGCDYELALELGNKGSTTTVPTADKVTYNGKIKTYLDDNCITCHSAGAAISNLTSWATVESRAQSIYNRVAEVADMPKGKTSSAADKAMLKSWKEGGFLEKAAAGQTADIGAGTLAAIYYKNTTAHIIKKADIQGQASYKVSIKLQLQQAGRDIGLGAASEQPNSGGGVVPNPIPTVQAPFTLTGQRDIKLSNDPTGQAAPVSINSLVKGKKLIIDFSTTNCGFCITQATELNNDKAEQAKFDDQKCTYITITQNAGDLQTWTSRFAGTYVAKTSYYVASQVAYSSLYKQIFASNSPGTPTFAVITEDGVSKNHANDLKSVMAECQ